MADAVVALTDADFTKTVGEGVALVDFGATWCPPCRMQEPIVEKLAARFAGRALVGKLDVDEGRETAARFGVQSVPTLVVLRGGEEVERFVGLQTEEKLAAALDAALGT